MRRKKRNAGIPKKNSTMRMHGKKSLTAVSLVRMRNNATKATPSVEARGGGAAHRDLASRARMAYLAGDANAEETTKCDMLRLKWCATHCGRDDLVPTFRDRGGHKFAWRCEPPGLAVPANATISYCGAYSLTSARKTSRTRSRESNHMRTISQGCHGERFLLSVQKPTPEPCSEAAYKRALAMAKVLGDELHRSAERFAGHGYLGVFSPDYQGTKTRFIFDTMCRPSAKTPIKQICEIGFNAGESAVLFLEAAPTARVVSFDFGDKPWTRRQGELLKKAYGDRFELRLGSSTDTLPKYHDEQKKLDAPERRPCDMALIDGAKTYDGRLTDLRNMQTASRPGALLFLDEVTSRGCATGELPLEKCLRSRSTTQLPPLRAYHKASRDGLLKVGDCAFPSAFPYDGFCAATLKELS